MPIFIIGLVNTLTGSVIGTKIVSASSEAFIRSHPGRYVGPERAIGQIERTDFKSVSQAMGAAQEEHGYRVERGTRVYDRKAKVNTVWDRF